MSPCVFVRWRIVEKVLPGLEANAKKHIFHEYPLQPLPFLSSCEIDSEQWISAGLNVKQTGSSRRWL